MMASSLAGKRPDGSIGHEQYGAISIIEAAPRRLLWRGDHRVAAERRQGDTIVHFQFEMLLLQLSVY
jgi:hypothetical protein